MPMSAAAPLSVPVRRAYAAGRFGQLHYRIARPEQDTGPHAGKPPLVCLHLSPMSGRIYEVFASAMGADRMVIAPDTPGFGDSDPPPAAPTIDDYAAAMGELLDALGLRGVDVMGYHTGSETATALALARPDQVRKLVLISAPIFTADELAEFRAHYAHEVVREDGAHLVRKWKAHLRWAGPGWTPDHVALQFPDALRNPQISWWGHNAAFSYDMAANLARVAQPVLVLNPDDDLHEHTWRAQPILRNGRVHHLKGWGHGFLDVRTQETCALVRGFLDWGG